MAKRNTDVVIGWFEYTVSRLISGDLRLITDNPMDIKFMVGTCQILQEFSRLSRKGWWTLEHPRLGLVQWKSGEENRHGEPYFYLRINGKPVVESRDEEAKYGEGDCRRSYAVWVSQAAWGLKESNEFKKTNVVEAFLGSIQDGTCLPVDKRAEALASVNSIVIGF